MSIATQKIVSIHQPNFIPWLGYFYKIQVADVFVILDNVDYQAGNSSSITNRTKIKTNTGELMISVPVKKNEQSKLIIDTEIDNRQPWKAKMLKTIQFAYTKAPYFKTVFPEFEKVLNQPWDKLSDLNSTLIVFICEKLNIQTQIIKASEMGLQDDDKNGRIIEICKKLEASVYLSGNGARKYNDEEQYTSNNMELRYSEYAPPEYPQLYGDFLKGLSILDVLLNCGWETTAGFVTKK